MVSNTTLKPIFKKFKYILTSQYIECRSKYDNTDVIKQARHKILAKLENVLNVFVFENTAIFILNFVTIFIIILSEFIYSLQLCLDY